MRLAGRQKIAAEKAAAIMGAETFAAISAAMLSGAPLKLSYTDRYGVKKKYSGVHPLSFFETPQDADWPGSVLLWAWHELHSKKEQYRVERILSAKIFITLLDALLDPSTNAEFWAGPKPEEKVISALEQLIQDITTAIDIPDKDRAVLDWSKKYISPSTTTVAGPSTDIEHEAYNIYVGGIPIYFDDLNDAVVTLVREMLSGAPLPKALKNKIFGIQIVEEDARGGPDVIGMSADGFVTIFGDRQVDMGVIAHEAAHDFAVSKWGDPIPPADSDYQKAINSGEPPVSEYSKRNASEDFAEAVGMFVTDPVGLKKIAPRRYNIIKRLMEVG